MGWIVFDQPAKMNAINDAMWRAIPEAMARFDADREVRCVAFRGEGTQAFAAGADISQFEEIRDGQAAVGEYDDLLDRVLHSIQDSRKPSVALIHGFCMGGGLEVALACDLRYCGESAQFAIPAAKLGLAYNVEGHKRLMETVGHARAREIMFLGRRYGAQEAAAMGLVHRVLPDAELGRLRRRGHRHAAGERAARHRQLQDHPRGIREVRGRAGRRGDARGDAPLRGERGLQGRAARVHGKAQAAI